MNRRVCVKFPCISDYVPFLTQKVIDLKNSNFVLFYRVLKLFDFSKKKYPLKSGYLVSIEKTGCEKPPCLSGCTQISTQKTMTLVKVEFLYFVLFLKLKTFLNNYPPKSLVLVSMGRTGYWSFACISGYAQFFLIHEIYDPGIN